MWSLIIVILMFDHSIGNKIDGDGLKTSWDNFNIWCIKVKFQVPCMIRHDHFENFRIITCDGCNICSMVDYGYFHTI